MISAEYDVEREIEFSRQQLRTTIPARLNELLDRIGRSRGSIEDWHADLIAKIMISVGRVCNDLFKTTDQEALSAAAWNARNLLELWVWTKYCSASRDNARRFHEDTLRDMIGFSDMHSKMCEVFGVRDEFATSREKVIEGVLDKLGLESIDANYTPAVKAAKSLGLENQYGPTNKFLSKLAHPTAVLVVGLMHQAEESLRGMQGSCTTMGLYFAGQCVIALEEIVLAAERVRVP